MRFNFEASSQDNGIIFTYKNQEKAVFVSRDVDGSIKEELLSAKEVIKGMAFMERCEYEIERKENYVVEILSIMIGVFCNFAYIESIYMYIMLTMYTVAYVSYKIYHIKHNHFSYRNKQYHSAEHMIYNLRPKEEISVEKLKDISNYANDCGSNLNLMCIVESLLTQGLVIFGYKLCIGCTHNSMKVIMMWILISILIMFSMNNLIIAQMQTGCFNYFQPLFLETPTDDQLELAIYGYRRAQELNKF